MSFFCCSQKTKAKRSNMQKTRDRIEKSVNRNLRLTNEQMFQFTQRFESQATLHRMNQKQYRDSLGLIGMQSLSFLADRMFSVMDKDKNGYISLDEYLSYIDIMMYGSDDEKLKQSFQLLDLKASGCVSFEDFNKIVHQFAKMWSAATGTPTPINLEYVKRIFNQMTNGKKVLIEKDFLDYMRVNPDGLIWFTKPEFALKQRVKDHYKTEKENERQRFIEHLDEIQDKQSQFCENITEQLSSAIDVLSTNQSMLQFDEGVTPGADEINESQVQTPKVQDKNQNNKQHTQKLVRTKSEPGEKFQESIKSVQALKKRNAQPTQMLFTSEIGSLNIKEFPKEQLFQQNPSRKLYQTLNSSRPTNLKRAAGTVIEIDELTPTNIKNSSPVKSFVHLSSPQNQHRTGQFLLVNEFHPTVHPMNQELEEENKNQFTLTKQPDLQQQPVSFSEFQAFREIDKIRKDQNHSINDRSNLSDLHEGGSSSDQNNQSRTGVRDQPRQEFNERKADVSPDDTIQHNIPGVNNFISPHLLSGHLESCSLLGSPENKPNQIYPGNIVYVDTKMEEDNLSGRSSYQIGNNLFENEKLNLHEKYKMLDDLILKQNLLVAERKQQVRDKTPAEILVIEDTNRQQVLQDESPKVYPQWTVDQQGVNALTNREQIEALELKLQEMHKRMEIASSLMIQTLKEVREAKNAFKDQVEVQLRKYGKKVEQSKAECYAQNVPKLIKKKATLTETIKQRLNNQEHLHTEQIEVANVGGNVNFNEPQKQQVQPPQVKNLVHPGHQSFNIVFNIMLGIKKSVDATLDIPLIHITEKDYKIKCKYEIAPYRTEATDSVKACTFFDYAPQIFANIRKSSGISKKQYSESLGPEQILCYIFNANFRSLSELCSTGKSGSFFYYTQDQQFLLKTIPRHEFKYMKQLLKNYHEFLTQKNPDSLICKIYGLHKVIFYKKKAQPSYKQYFCIMNNVFQTRRKIDVRYDLKGSTYGRRTITDPTKPIDNTIALKDCEFLEKKQKFRVGEQNRRKIMEIIRKDCEFFSQNNINDYSLLIGICNRSESGLTQQYSGVETPISVQQAQEPSPLGTLYNSMTSFKDMKDVEQEKFYQACDGGLMSNDKSQIYFFGIIDILTEFNMSKRAENIYKSVIQDAQTVSCIPPNRYADRFYQFMNEAFV